MSDSNQPLRLSEANLYAGGTLVVRGDGTQELNAVLPIYQPGPGDRIHPSVGPDDMLDGLAYHYWKDEVEDADRYWWVLAHVNNISNPLDLSAFRGKQLLVPDLRRYKLLAAAQQ